VQHKPSLTEPFALPRVGSSIRIAEKFAVNEAIAVYVSKIAAENAVIPSTIGKFTSNLNNNSKICRYSVSNDLTFR
jgi:hypothetical protein